ncbi:MAG: MetQ/NlpA family ABC transporter substrate-binding protein [Defluviitaleaceae bacterium]|nr:MetQ/NlpA family ABC transporter substrate-binding protein [Defluviitaleaceae bacterium]
MKKLISLICICLLIATIAVLTGCESAADNEFETLVIGATAVPHAEILEFIRTDMLEQGISLEIREFSDFSLVNPALRDGQIDVNYFQHAPFLNNFVENTGAPLVSVCQIHIEPMGIYSNNLNDLSEIQPGSTVGIQNDATNQARALLLLENVGLITLREGAGVLATVHDIAENPLDLNILEIDAAMLPRTLNETAISTINTNFALQAGLNPMNDALAIENSDSPYANLIVVREEDLNREAVQILLRTLQTEMVREFILENYEGAVVPVF